MRVRGKDYHRQVGFTLIELVVVLVIIGILTAVLTPMVSSYLEQARVSRAQKDTKAIADTISRFERDMGRYPMFATGTGLLQDVSGGLVRLQGSGDLPGEASTTAWTSGTPTDSDCTAGCTFGTLGDQLVTNAPAYPTTSAQGRPFNWRGPYLDPGSDPWGNAYLVNIINAKSGSADACFVLSAGPDSQVETAFNISETTSVVAAGDDIIYRIK